jgi:hypothetical protein
VDCKRYRAGRGSINPQKHRDIQRLVALQRTAVHASGNPARFLFVDASTPQETSIHEIPASRRRRRAAHAGRDLRRQCIKGAIVGGVAGHYAGHHGMLGAAAGCLYGRHHANEQEKQQQQQSQVNGQGKL